MSECLRRAAVPVKRVWLGLRARLGRRRSGLGELRREVRTCEYDDVHVMWGLLSGMDGSAPRKYVYVPVPDSGALPPPPPPPPPERSGGGGGWPTPNRLRGAASSPPASLSDQNPSCRFS